MNSNLVGDDIIVVEDKTNIWRPWPTCDACESKVKIRHDDEGFDWTCPSCEAQGKGLPGEPWLSDTHRVCDVCDGGAMIVPIALIARVTYYDTLSATEGGDAWACPSCVEMNEWRRSMSFKAMMDKANSGTDDVCESCGWSVVAELRGRRLCQECIDDGKVDLATEFKVALDTPNSGVYWDGACTVCGLRVKVTRLGVRWLCHGCINNGEAENDET